VAQRDCYGLAEATLLVSGGQRGAGPTRRDVSGDALRQGQVEPPANIGDCRVLIGCGRALVGEVIAIVDSGTRRKVDSERVGEVWVHGPHVAQGYWRNAVETNSVFQGRIDGEGDACWLRTGDLGFLDEAGELFITGRIKDVIIVRGMNHYPQDIESTVQNCHPALRRHCGAAFTVLDGNNEERLILVQEVERVHRHQPDADDIIGHIREAVADEHEIAVDQIVLIRPGAIPKTTSGKVRRRLTRQLWLEDLLDVLE